MDLVIAKYDYRAQETQELDLTKGDRLRLLDDSRNWWKVQLLPESGGEGKVGYVPSNYVRRVAPQQQQRREPGGSGGEPSGTNTEPDGTAATARYGYEPARDDELRLRRGDTIRVLEKSPDGWWRGQLPSGESGWFPSNYVSEQDDMGTQGNNAAGTSNQAYNPQLPASPGASCMAPGMASTSGLALAPQTPAAGVILETVLCLYTFRAQNKEELSFAKGDKLDILEHPAHDPEWWLAVDAAGRTGLVPTNYIQVLKRHDSQPLPTSIPITSLPASAVNNDTTGGSANNNVSSGSPYQVKQRCTGPLRDRAWYYGRLSRQQSDAILDGFGTDGDFLVRDSESNPGDYSVSLKASTRNKHFWVHVDSAGGRTDFKIGNRNFASLDELLQHYTAHPIYTSDKTGEKLYLVRPLPALR